MKGERTWLLATAAIVIASAAVSAHALEFNVTDTYDDIDANPGDGVCADSSGSCTLRAAVMEANATTGADTIKLGAGVFNLTVAGREDNARGGDLDISDDLTIVGAGRDQSIVDGGGRLHYRVFHTHIKAPGATPTSVGPTVGVSRLTVRNGVDEDEPSPDGGCISHTAGFLSLDDVEVSGCQARGGGGGIWANADLRTTNSEIKNNTVDDQSNSLQKPGGGGLLVTGGRTSLVNVHVTGNKIVNSSVGVGGPARGGGGMSVSGSARVTIESSKFVNNSTTTSGGAIDARGSWMFITNSEFTGNSADGGGSDFGSLETGGGAIACLNFSSSTDTTPALVVVGGVVKNNQSRFAMVLNCHSELEGVSITGNSGTGIQGGAPIEVRRCLVAENVGLGIAAAHGVLRDSTVAKNSGSGVGAFNPCNFHQCPDGTLDAINSTIVENQSPAPAEGANVLSSYRGQVSFVNSIIGTSNGAPNCAGTPLSHGHNIASDASCGLTRASDLPNVAPQLLALADNGGPTRTYALASGSPAVSKGDSATCSGIDQRYYARPAGAPCDLGAFQTNGQPAVIGVAKFTQASYAVNEVDKKVVIKVVRVDGNEGDLSVLVEDVPGTAGEKDYTPSVQVVRWNDGDASEKAVEFLINKDAEVESAEKFTVRIHPIVPNAFLPPSQQVAEINIIDSDGPSSPTPIIDGNAGAPGPSPITTDPTPNVPTLVPGSDGGGGGALGISWFALFGLIFVRGLRARWHCCTTPRNQRATATYSL